MHAYRYPKNNIDVCTRDVYDVSRGTAGGPLPGTAFAICAAVLPLLRCQDITVCGAALSLLRKALPLCAEPLWCIEEQAAFEALSQLGVRDEDAVELRNHTSALCTERIQHLLSRLEQVPPFYMQHDRIFIRYDCTAPGLSKFYGPR